jgi:hypothetical protein
MHLCLDVWHRAGDDRQSLPISEVLDEEIVLKLIGGLKDGRDHAVGSAQQYEGNKDDRDGFVLDW